MTIPTLSTIALSLLTVLAFIGARGAARLVRQHPLANPTLLGALIVGAVLTVMNIEVETYVIAARPLGGALDLAIVALGVGLAPRLKTLGRRLWRAAAALIAGVAFGMVSAVLLGRLFSLPPPFLEALSVKTVSSGFAIALMEATGGPPPLAAGLVVATGVVGALTLPPLLIRFAPHDDIGLGLGTGTAAHIVGTDALMRTRREAAVVAALAMAMAGPVAALFLPMLRPFIG
ncbi:MAG: LrgB family protein [Pseudomonadota bacterium]